MTSWKRTQGAIICLLLFIDMSASSSSSSGRGGPKKTRRKRSNISGEILQCLEKFYQNKPHPDSQERRQLALELGETENLVRIWFQNRRAKRQRVRNQLLLQEVSKHGGKGQSTDDKSLSKSPTTIPNSDGRKKASSSDDGTSSSILFPSSHHIQPSSSLENIHSSVQAKLQASCQVNYKWTTFYLESFSYSFLKFKPKMVHKLFRCFSFLCFGIKQVTKLKKA